MIFFLANVEPNFNMGLILVYACSVPALRSSRGKTSSTDPSLSRPTIVVLGFLGGCCGGGAVAAGKQSGGDPEAKQQQQKRGSGEEKMNKGGEQLAAAGGKDKERRKRRDHPIVVHHFPFHPRPSFL